MQNFAEFEIVTRIKNREAFKLLNYVGSWVRGSVGRKLSRPTEGYVRAEREKS